jgi:hypothetical protein
MSAVCCHRVRQKQYLQLYPTLIQAVQLFPHVAGCNEQIDYERISLSLSAMKFLGGTGE